MTIVPEHAWHDLARRIDTLLANHGVLRASLRVPHPPFDASPAEAMKAYIGPDGSVSPLYGLWLTCANVEALRLAWTGKPTPGTEPTPALKAAPAVLEWFENPAVDVEKTDAPKA